MILSKWIGNTRKTTSRYAEQLNSSSPSRSTCQAEEGHCPHEHWLTRTPVVEFSVWNNDKKTRYQGKSLAQVPPEYSRNKVAMPEESMHVCVYMTNTSKTWKYFTQHWNYDQFSLAERFFASVERMPPANALLNPHCSAIQATPREAWACSWLHLFCRCGTATFYPSLREQPMDAKVWNPSCPTRFITS